MVVTLENVPLCLLWLAAVFSRSRCHHGSGENPCDDDQVSEAYVHKRKKVIMSYDNLLAMAKCLCSESLLDAFNWNRLRHISVQLKIICHNCSLSFVICHTVTCKRAAGEMSLAVFRRLAIGIAPHDLSKLQSVCVLIVLCICPNCLCICPNQKCIYPN